MPNELEFVGTEDVLNQFQGAEKYRLIRPEEITVDRELFSITLLGNGDLANYQGPPKRMPPLTRITIIKVDGTVVSIICGSSTSANDKAFFLDKADMLEGAKILTPLSPKLIELYLLPR